MKMKNKIFTSAIALIGFVATSNAQVSATATASANIVAPITITKDVDLHFGNVAVHASTAGTVVLNPTTEDRQEFGGVTLPAVPGPVQAAEFTVTGEGNYTYEVTLPANVVVSNGINNMTVDNFTTSLPDDGTVGTLDAGSQVFKVGATLNVAGGQAAGLYTSEEPFTVTVNYN